MKRRPGSDRGSAVIEYIVLVVLVLVPIVYIVLAVMRVQSAAYAVTQAAREAGRAFVQADSAHVGRSQAQAAVAIAMADQGFDVDATTLHLSCSQACLSPGSRVDVLVSTRVALPFVPDSVAGTNVGSVPVQAEHVVPVDDYRSAP